MSDYFYIWMRNSLRDVYPDLFSTMLVPKKEELVAIPYRFGGDERKAKTFFEEGMLQACTKICQYSSNDYPVTIYYAYKQSDSSTTGSVSSGWETMALKRW